MLRWLRDNWVLATTAFLAVLYKTLCFLLTFPALSEMPANYGGAAIEQNTSQNSPDYYVAMGAIAAVIAAIAGLFLVAVTYGLWRATGRLATSTEDLASGADAQAAAQNRANDIAEMGNSIAANALDEAIKEHKLNWHKWATEQRARLRIRLLRVLPLKEGEPIKIEFDVVNIGGNTATITGKELRIQLDGTHRQASFAPEKWSGSFDFPGILEEGNEARVLQESDIIFRDWSFPGMPWRPERNIRIIGKITYTDVAGIIRRTGFYRISSDDTNRFRLPGDRDVERDYEYED